MSEIIIIEAFYNKPTHIQLSLINGNEYNTWTFIYFNQIMKLLKPLSQNYKELLLDINRGEEPYFINCIKENKLTFNISKPSLSQKKTMEKERLTLIGLYIRENRLKKNDNLL